MPIQSTDVPDALIYFNVFVPARSNTREDAERIVGRYLRSPFAMVDVMYSDDCYGEPADCFKVKVRGVVYGTAGGQIEDQRDRFASGMYITSEPVVYLPVQQD